MFLSGLLDTLAADRRCGTWLRSFLATSHPPRAESYRAASGARPVLLAALARESQRSLLVVEPRPNAAERLYGALAAYVPAERTLLWTAPDAIPYEQLPVDAEDVARRIATLGQLFAARQRAPQDSLVVVTSARGLLAHVLTRDQFEQHRQPLAVGQQITASTLDRWLKQGYEPVATVQAPGQFSRRGGVIDIYSPGDVTPTRIELFGDSIESLRPFNPVTQRSLGHAPSVTVLPASDVPLWERERALRLLADVDTGNLRPEVAAQWRRLLDLLRQGETPPVQELLGAYLTDRPGSLLDHLPSNAIVVLDEPDTIDLALNQLIAQAEELRAGFEAGGELPRGLRPPYHERETIEAGFARFDCLRLGSDSGLGPASAIGDIFGPTRQYAGRIERLAEDISGASAHGHHTVMVTVQDKRLGELLGAHNVTPRHGASVVSPLPAVSIVRGDIPAGWSFTGSGQPAARSDGSFTVLSDGDIFGTVRVHRRPSTRTAAQHQAFIRALTPGQLVVHLEHGIARFTGLVTLEVDGAPPDGGAPPMREFLALQYSGDDRLYVPVDQTDRVAPYSGPGGDDPPLNRLGSVDWAKTKRRVQRAVEDMADELLALYAAREAAPGHAFSPDTPWDRELEESFPYTETEDQFRAISEVKDDMERTRPMDRVVAGDVGYGKTEVALRAAFKAVNDGTQVVVLVPTTVLALQHMRTFQERLAAFPARVEMLSRLRTTREREAVKLGLATGQVDIVIGTHALLSNDVRIKNLGLVIVDEEQRFGVRHKERLKQLRTSVDVLTMSATPIPRTLHQALSGIRDLSVIDTPPQDRAPIRTFVAPHHDATIREVVLRELDRGGQTFFVHNRVRTLPMVAAHLRELLPEARIVHAHGQMDQGELERIMIAFIRGEYDVLVSTTIIESGLDIPTVNTIVIDDAPHFGLTQLHQLRGRVGRSDTRAYCYLLYHPGRPMTTDAQERLETIQSATELGAGFRIAMKDLELRGAGNLLGAEQSGHIAAVGFDLYVQLLSAAVEEKRTGVTPKAEHPVRLDLPLTALLPPTYITDVATRLREYRRLAATREREKVDELGQEWIDRFGPLPDEVRSLLYLSGVKLRAIALGIEVLAIRDRVLSARPVPTDALDHRSLRRAFGEALSMGPTSLRVSLRNEGASWEATLEQLLHLLETARPAREVPPAGNGDGRAHLHPRTKQLRGVPGGD